VSHDEYSVGAGDYDDVDEVALPAFLFDPVGVLRRRWPWMILILVAGLALGGAYLQFREPVYRARATVLVASQKISEQFVQATVETDPLEKVSAILGELMSRRQLAAMINEYSLYVPDDGAESTLTMEEKVSIMREQIQIGEDRSNTAGFRSRSTASVFEIVFSDRDPVKAANVANDLASGFQDIHIRMRSRQARLTTEFLGRELTQVEKELGELERKITIFKQTYRGQLPSELATNLGRLDRLQAQRQSLALQIVGAESRLATLAASGTDLDPDSAEASMRSLQIRYKEQRSLYTEEHPNVVSVASQIDLLKREIINRAGSSSATGSVEADAARLTLVALRKQLEETVAEFEDLDRRVGLVPKRHEELAGMEQRAEILQESHREFLRKVNQAELAEAVELAQQGERATLLDAALPPTDPESSTLFAVIVILIGSFGATVGFAILLELIDSVIVSSDEIEQEFGLPVLGSIPTLD
jgi:succinoglycan biosynthesis transport protein ExoP